MVPTVNKGGSGQSARAQANSHQKSKASDCKVLPPKPLKDRGKLSGNATQDLSTGAGSENTVGSNSGPAQGNANPIGSGLTIRHPDDVSLDEEAICEWIREKAIPEAGTRRLGSVKDTNLPASLPGESLKENQILEHLYSLFSQGKASDWRRQFKVMLDRQLSCSDKFENLTGEQRTKLKTLQLHPVFCLMFKEYTQPSTRPSPSNPGNVSATGRGSVARWPSEQHTHKRVLDEPKQDSPLLVTNVKFVHEVGTPEIGCSPKHSKSVMRTKVDVNLDDLFKNEASATPAGPDTSESNSNKMKRRSPYRPTDRCYLGKRKNPANVIRTYSR